MQNYPNPKEKCARELCMTRGRVMGKPFGVEERTGTQKLYTRASDMCSHKSKLPHGGIMSAYYKKKD